jgi:hypothetical protein
MVYIRPRMSLRGVIATKQSQNEIATPFGLAMTPFLWFRMQPILRSR